MVLKLVSFGLWLAILIPAVSSSLVPRQSCSAGYTLCSPPGATGSGTYDQSDGLHFLYLNILNTVQPPASEVLPQSIDPNGPAKRQSATSTMCCATGLSCLLLINANVPMCYDKFTTDYALPNGDYGTVSNGSFITPSGVHANLITGDYIVPNGQTGNIYSAVASDRPNTTTLTIPTQDTSSGVGSAIPASQLGSSPNHVSQAITITGTASPSTLSLSGPAVTPCSTCCNDCGRPSTTVHASMPTLITSMPSGSGTGTATFPSYTAGVGNATTTPPITVGAGARLVTCKFSAASVAVVATMLLLLISCWSTFD